MDCKEFRNTVADLFDKENSPHIRQECREHISHCTACRKHYEDLLATARLLQPKHSPIRQKSSTLSRRWLKVAALFAGILLVSGLALATIRLTRPAQNGPEQLRTVQDSSEQLILRTQQPSTVRFDEVHLDSILAVVSAHYGKTVVFRSERAKAMQFIMTWKPDASLADFLDELNMFDGLLLDVQNDTIFVEITEGKEKTE